MPKRIAWLPTFLAGIIAVYLLFPDWFAHPNTKVIEGYGDGYKAYHAILYHAKYDSTYSWYEGMNYPYGEHVVPGASQPLISNGIRLLEAIGIPAADYGWAIVHFIMLLGILVAMLFTFLLLQRMGVRWWLATFAALSMTLMAPQIDRIIAHYGLAHPEVLPAILYYLKRWDEKPGWWPALAVAVCVWLFSQIHFYYFAILAFTIGGFLAARWLLARDFFSLKKTGHYAWTLFLMFGLPAIYFFSWFALTDPVIDRNEAPWGFFAFLTGPLGVLTSHTQPYWQWLHGKTNMFYPGFEGWAYVGLPAVVFIFFLLGRSVKNRFRTSFLTAPTDSKLYLHSLLFAAFGILIFSFGIPVKQLGGEHFLEHLGPLRQFRSIGRFAWLFYYAINLALFVQLEAGLKSTTAGKKPLIALLLVLVVAPAEVRNFWQSKNFNLDDVAGLNEPTLAQQTGLDFSKYQAIIPVPYYNIGSDNFWWEQSGFIGQKVQTLSWQTGLSTNAAMLTRTSLQQTLKQLQFITEPYRYPELLDDLPNEKPFLIAYDSARWHEFGDESNHLVAGLEPVFDADGLQLFEVPLSSWRARLKARVEVAVAGAQSDSLQLNDFVNNDSIFVFYEDFGDDSRFQTRPSDRQAGQGSKAIKRAAKNDRGYRGSGYSGDLSQENRIIDVPQDLELPPGDYIFSFWMDIAHDRFARATFDLNFWQDEGQQGPNIHYAIQQKVRVMDPNGWALIEFPVKIAAPTAGMLLQIRMPLLKGQELRVDDVLLRPAQTDIYRQLGDTVYHNNRYYPLGILQ